MAWWRRKVEQPAAQHPWECQECALIFPVPEGFVPTACFRCRSVDVGPLVVFAD